MCELFLINIFRLHEMNVQNVILLIFIFIIASLLFSSVSPVRKSKVILFSIGYISCEIIEKLNRLDFYSMMFSLIILSSLVWGYWRIQSSDE